ncbi:Uncharacterized protein TCM_025804 [Theobroma cacao]|uniref:Reverse transcriptase Ty1/copia-type domain-containing protein n=1 Tax=Theobroma cacao TaxID=3641 RepID=A0A061F053_THECC|nr:Uncharacterized protein TCM_025804 [Theobroma cacao]
MKCELKALKDNGTWSVIPLPTNSFAIGCKWVFKGKMNVDGAVERYKAWLVLKVATSIDYNHKLSRVTDSDKVADSTRYRQLIVTGIDA